MWWQNFASFPLVLSEVFSETSRGWKEEENGVFTEYGTSLGAPDVSVGRAVFPQGALR